jgi:hypothetical protein
MKGRSGREAELIPREVGESREVLSARLPLLPPVSALWSGRALAGSQHFPGLTVGRGRESASGLTTLMGLPTA